MSRPLRLLLAGPGGVASAQPAQVLAADSLFDAGEARLLLPGGDRVILYQIAAASGVRFTNGYMELRGKGMDLQLIRESVAVRLLDCLPYVPPATPD